ncbi:alginate lyase 2 [Lindgomyces ingoldianus]|uniref:Alginate lyase 2 n=1 Tax=Lindgomyces ingoldianus TaxID=673940 RepID=A0ACB6RFL2_9PLEO|nr:alginate lyase 2 [Lindgomyces ingoldianus]KAF2478034.1 alginate lyase 2 [Lindgomyces ingoldianus]
MTSLLSNSLFLLLGSVLAAPFTPNLVPRALNPSCAPGGNFDLSLWNLQLPTGTQGHIDQITSSTLKGCSGYSTSNYFFTDSKDGALIMKVPGSPSSAGCVTTSGSKHCRTELREVNPSSWDPRKQVNRLKAKLSVPTPDDSKYGTVIGQIHVDDSVSSKPVCELFYNKNGDIAMGVEQIPDESSLKYTAIGNVPKNQTFTYEIRYEGGKLSVGINGEVFKTLGTGGLESPKSYFKVGNYNQGDSASSVRFLSIDVAHS